MNPWVSTTRGRVSRNSLDHYPTFAPTNPSRPSFLPTPWDLEYTWGLLGEAWLLSAWRDPSGHLSSSPNLKAGHWGRWMPATILQNNLMYRLHRHVDGSPSSVLTRLLALPSQSLNLRGYLSGSRRLSPQLHSGQFPFPEYDTCHDVPNLFSGSISQNDGHQSPGSSAFGHATISLSRSPLS